MLWSSMTKKIHVQRTKKIEINRCNFEQKLQMNAMTLENPRKKRGKKRGMVCPIFRIADERPKCLQRGASISIYPRIILVKIVS